MAIGEGGGPQPQTINPAQEQQNRAASQQATSSQATPTDQDSLVDSLFGQFGNWFTFFGIKLDSLGSTGVTSGLDTQGLFSNPINRGAANLSPAGGRIGRAWEELFKSKLDFSGITAEIRQSMVDVSNDMLGHFVAPVFEGVGRSISNNSFGLGD